jgi:hypothetical protein
MFNTRHASRVTHHESGDYFMKEDKGIREWKISF